MSKTTTTCGHPEPQPQAYFVIGDDSETAVLVFYCGACETNYYSIGTYLGSQ